MNTIETELKKYNTCRAERDRGCSATSCIECTNNIPRGIFRDFAEIEAILSGMK